MANITLAGTLRDPNGDLAVGDKVRFTHKSTTGETVKSASSILTIDPTGVYSVDLEYGLVLVEYKDARNAQFENLGVATVNGDNPATTIPELLNALVPVSSTELIEFQAILADCVAAQVAAEVAQAAAEAAAATLDLINDLSQSYIFDTVALFKASLIEFPDGKIIHLNDRDADFTKILGQSGTGNRVVPSTGVNQSISLIVVGAPNINQFGGISGTDSTDAIYEAINYGSNIVTCNPSQSFVINKKIVPLANQTLDLNNSKLKMIAGVAFLSTDSMVELLNVNSHVVNFELDGNKSAVTHAASTGTDLAGVIVRASNCSVTEGYIHDCVTNGVLSYASGISNILFNRLRIEDNDWIATGNEIPTLGDANAKNITFSNIETFGNGLGGLYLAGGKNIIVNNVNTNDANRNYFYVGDAEGGLINCKVSDSTFATTNNAVVACEVQGEVQTGPSIGVRLECDVSFSNVEVQGSGSVNGLTVDGGAKLRYSNLTLSTGSFIVLDADVKGSRLKVDGTTSNGVSLSSKATLKDTEIKNYGVNGSGVFFNTGSGNSVIDGLKVGAATGETGEHGLSGVAGLVGLEIKRFKEFTGTGNKLNFSSTDMKAWSFDDNDTALDLQQQGTWNGKALFVGSGFIWIDGTGDVRVKASLAAPTSDTDGVIVGTQT